MRILTNMALGVLLLPGVAWAQDTEHEFDSSADFSKYQTYRWVESDEIPLAVPYQPDTPRETTDAIIRSAIEEELGKKGITQVETGQADLEVTYFGIGRSRVELPEDLPYDESGFKGMAKVVTEGTVTVDIVDVGKKHLVWRGQVVEIFREVDESEATLRSALTRLFEKFPPE